MVACPCNFNESERDRERERERERGNYSLLSAIYLKFIVFKFDKFRYLTCLLLHCSLFTFLFYTALRVLNYLDLQL